jgi:hypothetical protein
MASNPNTYITGLRFMRLRDARGYTGHAMFARACELLSPGAYMLVVPTIGEAQGRIVSISRGSPPPKKR